MNVMVSDRCGWTWVVWNSQIQMDDVSVDYDEQVIRNDNTDSLPLDTAFFASQNRTHRRSI